MKTSKTLLFLAAIGASAATAFAQMVTNDPGGGNMTNQSGGMWWTNTASLMTNMMPAGVTNRHQVVQANHQQHGTMPGRTGGHMTMPADLQALMQQFQADRQAFMANQKAMESQMQSATEQQRQELMAQMQQQLQQMKEQHAQLRQTMQDQMQQMMQKMQDQQRLLDRGGQGGGSHGGRPR